LTIAFLLLRAVSILLLAISVTLLLRLGLLGALPVCLSLVGLPISVFISVLVRLVLLSRLILRRRFVSLLILPL
jgi:hypothetical protein